MKQIKLNTKRWLFSVFMIGSFLPGFTGEIDYHYVDSVTYHHYVNQNWDSLIIIGKKAIEHNIDYYYLRMRMGVAYNAKEKYASSAKCFNKALEFNQFDSYANSNLYYSYLNMGKNSRAYRLSKNFSENLKQSMGIKPKPLELVDLFGGYTFSNNADKNGNIKLFDAKSDMGQQIIIGDQKYLHAGLMFNIIPSFSLYAGSSFIDIAKRTRFEFAGQGHENGHEKSFDSYIKQYEFYLNGKIQLDKGWALNLFANLLYISTPIIEYQERNFKFIEKDSSFVNWVAGINLQKDFDFITINAFGTISKLSKANQGQLGLSCFYYPLGSTKLYGQTEFIGFFESGGLYDNDQRLLFHQMIGLKLFNKTWLEAEYLSGNLNNVNIKQALVVYNLPEKINFIAGLNLHIFATKNLEISLIYNYSDKNGFYKSKNITNGEIKDYTFNYQTQSIIGGIKWTF